MPVITYIADPRIAGLVGEIDGVWVVTDGPEGPPADLAEAEIYVPRLLASGGAIDLLDEMPQLKLVQLATAGAETWVGKSGPNVTMATARGAHGAATAEWAVGALVAVLREFPGFVLAQQSGQWTSHLTDGLAGKKALVVGAGDLGERVLQRLEAFDVQVTMVARQRRAGVAAIADISQLLPENEIVVLVLPLTAESEGLVDARFLAAMPDGAVLVNAARGPVVDTDALLAELNAGRIRAALDVTDPEPLPPDHPLWKAPNVLITPHVGGSVKGSESRAAAVVRAQILRYVKGEKLENTVTDAGY